MDQVLYALVGRARPLVRRLARRASGERLDAIERRLGGIEVALHALDERHARETAATMERITGEVRAIHQWQRGFTRSVDAFKGAASDHLAALTAFERTASDHLAALTQQLEMLEAVIADRVERGEADLRAWRTDLEPRLATFHTNTSRHLAALTGQTEILEVSLREIVADLRALPYMADPTALATQDAAGKPAIGYRSLGDLRRALGDEGAYRGFEEIFRGPEAFIRDRQRVYLPVIGERRPVVDIGCGRGEFLDLLAAAGIPATGVDTDADMVARCRAKGHTATVADGVQYLQECADSSLGAVFCAQVIEHLPFDEVVALLGAAHRKLAPGGVLIAETVNPHALSALRMFWIDLTHRVPVYPEVTVALCALAGFDAAVVLFPHGEGELERDRYTQGEYAVIATKMK